MQVFVLERVIPPLVITFKLAVNSVSSNHIFALFLFLFNSHYLKKVSIDPVQNDLSIKVRKYPWTWSMTGDTWNGPKWGSMDPWSMSCPLDPKQSQDRVLKFKLSHRSFACWQADLCKFRGNFCGGSAIQRVHEWRPPKFSPQFKQVAWASTRRLIAHLIAYTCKPYKRYGGVLLRFWPFNAYAHLSTFSLIVIPLMFLYVVQLFF